jgi:TolA-binding protein
MTAVQRQLVQIQELTGQSQQRLTELRRQVDQRLSQPVVVQQPAPGDSTAPVTVPVAAGPSARELHDLSLEQLRRGSPVTARAGFSKLIEDYPDDPLVADALFFVGESWEGAEPDSAIASYERVAQDHRDSERAPTALYRLGLIAERRDDQDGARLYFQRVVAGYPQSDEAELARAKLNTPND